MASLAPRMRSVAANLHAHPEPPFQEYRAVRVLTSWLAEEGFAIETPYADLETSFRARRPGAADASPRLAVLVEYDALPGLGHACGHNLIAAGGAAAAIAAARRTWYRSTPRRAA